MAIPKINPNDPELEFLDDVDAAVLLDKQAQQYFCMSGAEFTRRFREGTLPDSDQSKIAVIAMLIPESERNGRTNA